MANASKCHLHIPFVDWARANDVQGGERDAENWKALARWAERIERCECTCASTAVPIAIKLFDSGTLIPTGAGFHPLGFDTVVWDSGDFLYTLPDNTIGFTVPGLYEFIGQAAFDGADHDGTICSTAVLASTESGQALGPVSPGVNSTVQPVPVYIVVDTSDVVFVTCVHDATADVEVTGFITAVYHGPMSKPVVVL